jgi:hypothetical protein
MGWYMEDEMGTIFGCTRYGPELMVGGLVGRE